MISAPNHSIRVRETSLSTEEGTSFWEVLTQVRKIPCVEQTLVEKLRAFLEQHEPLPRLVCTHNLVVPLRRLAPKQPLESFPASLNAFAERLDAHPTWFIAGQGTRFFACSLSLEKNEDEEPPVDALIACSPAIPSQGLDFIDLSVLPLSPEERWLLAFMGRAALLASPRVKSLNPLILI